jgi:hypothetical protein
MKTKGFIIFVNSAEVNFLYKKSFIRLSSSHDDIDPFC